MRIFMQTVPGADGPSRFYQLILQEDLGDLELNLELLVGYIFTRDLDNYHQVLLVWQVRKMELLGLKIHLHLL